MKVGSVKEIWRFPVKSLGGAALDSAHVHDYGIAGDRGWALVDVQSGDICSAKQLPGLLNIVATYVNEPGRGIAYRDQVPAVEIRFPDGRVLGPRDAQAQAIGEFVGRELKLCALEPPDNLEHYRMSAPMTEEQMMRMFNVMPGESGPDLSDYESQTIEKLMQYNCLPGTYYDVFPLHLITTAALSHMSAQSGEHFDHRRFRPSMLIDTLEGIEGIAEFGWVGKYLRIGEVLLKVESRTIRCSMPSREQLHYGIGRNPKISKSLYEATNRYFGTNVTVLRHGELRVGTDVELLDAPD